MKIVMVNDWAHVGETLIKYLPSHIDVVHLKRTRGLLDKTVRIGWKIFGAKGNVYYYLLQDCWLALRFGKHPIVGHVHGSDLREVVRSRRWEWMVKRSLEGCDKILGA